MLTRVPLYLQIQQFVRDGIRTGRFAEGRRLPSETELAARYRTTRATVAHAYHQLAFEGLVTRRIGSGTYVGRGEAQDRVDTSAFESHEEHVLASGETLTYRVLRFAQEPARADAAGHLDIAPGASVFRLERLRLVAGRPLAFELRFIPRGIASGIRRDSLAASTIQDILQDQLGLRIGTIDNAVRAAAVTARIATSLGMPKSMPVLVRAHTIRDTDARSLLFGETYYPAHFSIRYTLHAP